MITLWRTCNRATATFLWFSNLAITAKPPASPRYTDDFRCFTASFTNIHRLSADTHSQRGNKLRIGRMSANQVSRKKIPTFDLFARPGRFLFCFGFFPSKPRSSPSPQDALTSCGSGKTRTHATHKWVKPFPRRGGFPANRSWVWSHPRLFKNSFRLFQLCSHLIFLTPPTVWWKHKHWRRFALHELFTYDLPCDFFYVFLSMWDCFSYQSRQTNWNEMKLLILLCWNQFPHSI